MCSLLIGSNGGGGANGSDEDATTGENRHGDFGSNDDYYSQFQRTDPPA